MRWKANLFIALFPVSWPLSRLRNALYVWQLHRARRHVAIRDAWRVEDVRAAYMLVRESYSMASGPEEEERVLDLRLARGRRVGVVEGVFTAKHDLELRGVRVREFVVEGRSFGSVFGWLLWAVSCLAVAAIVWALLSGSVPAIYSAALTVAVLVGLLRM